MVRVHVVEDLEEFRKILKDSGNKLVVVDFTASWCGPCKFISPEFDRLSGEPENANVVFLKVDVDVAQDVSQECNISCMPTFHFYKNGKKVDEFSGAKTEILKEKLSSLRA